MKIQKRYKLKPIWHRLDLFQIGFGGWRGSFVDTAGDRWHVDEYGDMQYMWDYK